VPVSFKFWNTPEACPGMGLLGPIVVEYLLQLTDFCAYWRKIFLCIRHGRKEEERKAGDNPCVLSKSYIYIFVFESHNPFLCCKLLCLYLFHFT